MKKHVEKLLIIFFVFMSPFLVIADDDTPTSPDGSTSDTRNIAAAGAALGGAAAAIPALNLNIPSLNIAAPRSIIRRHPFGMQVQLPYRSVPFPSGGMQFNIRITRVAAFAPMWIDPVVATGYNYFIDQGPSVTDLQLPKGFGDNVYRLWLFDEASNDFVDSGVDIVGGQTYTFKKPVKKFSVRNIEVDASLDPEDAMAFPSRLTFAEDAKVVEVRMISLVTDTAAEK
jgi:hypothetical protein